MRDARRTPPRRARVSCPEAKHIKSRVHRSLVLFYCKCNTTHDTRAGQRSSGVHRTRPRRRTRTIDVERPDLRTRRAPATAPVGHASPRRATPPHMGHGPSSHAPHSGHGSMEHAWSVSAVAAMAIGGAANRNKLTRMTELSYRPVRSAVSAPKRGLSKLLCEPTHGSRRILRAEAAQS